MAFSIVDLRKSSGDPIMYESGFRTVIESHLNILRNSPLLQVETIEGHLIHQFEGDFYGLLSHLNVPVDQHWLYMRVNGMENPNQFGVGKLATNGTPYSLLMPPDEAINSLRTLYMTIRN